MATNSETKVFDHQFSPCNFFFELPSQYSFLLGVLRLEEMVASHGDHLLQMATHGQIVASHGHALASNALRAHSDHLQQRLARKT